jgi:serine/threonine-protein kinase
MEIGEYIIEAKAGEGEMGQVFKALHTELGKHVAIKIMTPKVFGEAESVKRFVSEARAIAAIEHIGIVDVYGFGRIPDGRTYLVMEWLDGKNLGERLKEGPLPWQDACDIIRQIARALEAAHAKGVIHRDLKPDNVFLKKQGDDDKPMVKLLDFGLAKTTQKDNDNQVAKTRSGQMLGTPLYMSPEQCKSKGVDHRTDIYALGCICFEVLVGRTPYDADNVAEIITAHLVAEPPRPSKFKEDFPADLDKLIFNMIAKDPDKSPPLGEVRRLLGMQLTRTSGVSPFSVDSTPFAAPYQTPPTGIQPPMFTPRPGTLPPPVSMPAPAPVPAPEMSMTDEEMVRALKGRPPWFFFVALAILAGVIAAVVVLK